jgi:tRNA pseudouridine55 synthase
MTPRELGAGLLVVAKPVGVTSFDVVAAARRALGIRRVGHAGTLDPDAVGVLPLLLGEATKLMPYLVDQDKEYRARIRFGVTTDTLDATGRRLSTVTVAGLTREAIEGVAAQFVGTIRQVPPMYSAVHHHGRRLYELARRGLTVEREARDVVVREITVEDAGESAATLRIVCGKGTYVRVLVAEIGAVLGYGALVEALERTRVGAFHLGGTVTLDEVRETARDALWARVEPPQAAIAGFSAVRVGAEGARLFVHGQSASVPGRPTARDALVRVHASDGVLLGVGEPIAGGARVRPVRVLHVDRPGTRVLPA